MSGIPGKVSLFYKWNASPEGRVVISSNKTGPFCWSVKNADGAMKVLADAGFFSDLTHFFANVGGPQVKILEARVHPEKYIGP